MHKLMRFSCEGLYRRCHQCHGQEQPFSLGQRGCQCLESQDQGLATMQSSGSGAGTQLLELVVARIALVLVGVFSLSPMSFTLLQPLFFSLPMSAYKYFFHFVYMCSEEINLTSINTWDWLVHATHKHITRLTTECDYPIIQGQVSFLWLCQCLSWL